MCLHIHFLGAFHPIHFPRRIFISVFFIFISWLLCFIMQMKGLSFKLCHEKFLFIGRSTSQHRSASVHQLSAIEVHISLPFWVQIDPCVCLDLSEYILAVMKSNYQLLCSSKQIEHHSGEEGAWNLKKKERKEQKVFKKYMSHTLPLYGLHCLFLLMMCSTSPPELLIITLHSESGL